MFLGLNQSGIIILLKKAMSESGRSDNKFIIEGFPTDIHNLLDCSWATDMDHIHHDIKTDATNQR